MNNSPSSHRARHGAEVTYLELQKGRNASSVMIIITDIITIRYDTTSLTIFSLILTLTHSLLTVFIAFRLDARVL
jgi:hypothetical protein